MNAVLSVTSVKNKTHRPAPVAERYGMLKVLMFMPKQGWLCKCDCGVERYIEGNHLRNLRYMSCGCDARKRQSAALKATLLKQKKKITVVPTPIKHSLTGTPCWVCRNKTGTTEVVALCRICERGCV